MRAENMDECECKEGAHRIGIAIVEDEKDLVKLYVKIFKRKNICVCFVAFDGREAVGKFIESLPKPRVILMDYRLPIMNGLEATKEILRLDPNSHVIFLSADVNVMDEAIKAGAKTFLKKPASLNDITDSVENALGRTAS